MKRILAVILNWNEAELTRDCCVALSGLCRADLQILVVDNGSTRHSVDDLKRLCPDAEVIGLGSNRGFAGGINAGLEAADWHRFDYVWLLNNDTVCDLDALDRLVARAESDTGLGAVGCAMHEGSVIGGMVRTVAAGQRLRAPFFIPTKAKIASEIDYLCGACLLIRREALETVGLLDERFFFFFEDADWCFRAKAAGWVLGVTDGVPVRHLGGGTIRRNSHNRARYYRAGHVRFLRHHATCPFIGAFVAMFYRVVVDLFHGRFAAVRGTLTGFWEGWRG